MVRWNELALLFTCGAVGWFVGVVSRAVATGNGEPSWTPQDSHDLIVSDGDE